MSKLRRPVEGRLEPGSPAEPVEFGKYYLLGMIARGGMAEVYRARLRDGDGTILAIKVMRPQIAREERFIDMFRREAELALILKTPSIVEALEVGEIDGRHYIAMEYIGGCDLTRLLRACQKTNVRIPVPHAVYMSTRIAEALHFAHNLRDSSGRLLNLVNRDVSPSNVRLSYDGDVKMLDFGIAQALMKFTSEIGVLKGKFSYMSPEQIRGMPLDARSDIFSAGIILHEVLTTEKLFRGDTEFALMEKVRKAEVKPPSAFNRRVSPELDAIVLKALGRSVEDRYQTAHELASELRAILEGYRFEQKELRQFLRQQFRSEYAQEHAEIEIAQRSLPSGLSDLEARLDLSADTLDEEPAERREPARSPQRAPQGASAPTPAPAPAGAEPQRSGGFWSRLRRKKPS